MLQLSLGNRCQGYLEISIFFVHANVLSGNWLLKNNRLEIVTSRISFKVR